jgi:hypothetical protein
MAIATTGISNAIIVEKGDRLIVDTSKPLANMMHDASRPFAVCERLYASRPGRVTCLGRYEDLAKAKRAMRYLGSATT